ncbi:MAG: hypothetical protein BA865_08575 [Desulfobacterales bacterium S5133MH4]|nr:MAG: hypothetical protein BA865_08575 [Desulfobacterales bacterium S5133MH4]
MLGSKSYGIRDWSTLQKNTNALQKKMKAKKRELGIGLFFLTKHPKMSNIGESYALLTTVGLLT